MTHTPVRTRFAPSPTGYLHPGSLRTALYAYLFAKHHGGACILRIDDTDRARYMEGAVEHILKTLRAIGLVYDEGPDVGGAYGPYVQSERLELYRQYAHELVAQGDGYYCFCDKDRLARVRAACDAEKRPSKYDGHCRYLDEEAVDAHLQRGLPYVIRQRVPDDGTTTFHDLILGDLTYENCVLDDQILIKSDGFPTYNFANVVDDHLMGITHVIRGTEFLPSTPKYTLLYKALEWEAPTYIHVPPIMKSATAKLSKRDGDISYEDLLNTGYLKEALLNYVLLLGWNPGHDREFFTLPEMIAEFDAARISKSPAMFDRRKLNWMNGEYLRKLSIEEFHAVALPWLRKGVKRDDIDLREVSKLLQSRIDVLSDIPAQIDFLNAVPDYSLELYANAKMKVTPEQALAHVSMLRAVLAGLPSWNAESIREAVFTTIQECGLKTGQVLWPLRVAVSGKQYTPGGGIELAALLGKRETLRRLEHAVVRLQAVQPAANYGTGLSERLLGKALGANRKDCVISTPNNPFGDFV